MEKKKKAKLENNKKYIIFLVLILLIFTIYAIVKFINRNNHIYYYTTYATNDWYNVSLYINEEIPAGIATYSTKEEALAAFPKNYLSTKPFLIAHRMYKDTILESYILFNKDGKYYSVMGGYHAGNLSNKEIAEIQKQNRNTLIEAFGEDSCLIADDYYVCESTYELANGKWEIRIQDDGRVRAAGYDSFCVIDKKGGSGCGVTPQN